MLKNLVLLLLFGALFSCSTDGDQQPLEKNSEAATEVFEAIISNPDFQLAYNKFLKDEPSSRRVQRIEFWLDTLIDRNSISNIDIDALHKQAGMLLESHAEKFTRKQFLMDSLFQNTIANGGQVTPETTANWDVEVNSQLGITQEDLFKQTQHKAYIQSLATTVQEERAARERLITQFPQLEDERFLAKVVEYYYQH